MAAYLLYEYSTVVVMNKDKYIWFEWAKKIHAIAQNGLAYSKNEFDMERYEQLRVFAAKIIEQYSSHSFEKIYDILVNEDGYATPIVDVRGVVFEDDRILPVKEKSEGKRTLRSKHAHYPQYPFHVYKLFFMCEIIGGNQEPGTETTDCGFFSLDGVPELSERCITRDQIARMFELRKEQHTECN